jgi:uncharacterized protein GlcG (DUF336 family)
MIPKRVIAIAVVLLCMAFLVSSAWAQGISSCAGLPSQSALKAALVAAVEAETGPNAGLRLNMWATIVARDGTVCAVAFSGGSAGAQWLGSRVISAQKANTANLFSLDSSLATGARATSALFGTGLALSSANLYTAVQPGGSLFGLQESNPVNPADAYGGNSGQYGTANDPMVGNKVGGINVFGGGLGLYATSAEQLIGGVGVSGDTSCEDHMVAWRLRANLGMDHLGHIAGVAAIFNADASHPDNIILTPGTPFSHPTCLFPPDPSTLPPVQTP